MTNRRTLLACAVRLASLPFGASFFATWMQAGQATQHQHNPVAAGEAFQAGNYKPDFFAPRDFEALQALTELLIPSDQTPGAKEAHCAEFIDFILASSRDFAPDTAQQWRSAMKAFDTAGFHTADAPGRAEILAEAAKPEIDPSAHHAAFPAYRLIKRETVFAFYTSRAGIIDTLDYRGNTYNLVFPACTHPEHHEL